MKLSALACLLLYIHGVSSVDNCTYYGVVKHLQLTEKRDMFTLVRPVKDIVSATVVKLDVSVYAILDVREVDQTFISYVWVTMLWKNDFIHWNPEDFCGITEVAVATDALWKPDITIQDMIEKDKSTPCPYMMVYHNGSVEHRNDQVVVSTCRMHAYKFPFDTQSCDLSFRSVMYWEDAIQLIPSENSTEATQGSLKTLRTQYEWLFINITITRKKVTPFVHQHDVITYSILMKRRSVLYVVNFVLPVLFFLALDLASFLISDTGGEKLGFKITVLLAVTVMQLLFNEILPSASDRVPLIAVFCVGIFFLMLLSLLESIVVLYLINKDEKQDQELDQDDPYRRLKDVISLSHSAIPSNSTLEKAQVSDHVLNVLTELLQNKREDAGPGYWTKKAMIINRIFIVFYTTTATLFLGTVFYHWMSEGEG